MREKERTMISDGEMRGRYGAAARKKYLEYYTPTSTYEGLMQIYEDTLSK